MMYIKSAAKNSIGVANKLSAASGLAQKFSTTQNATGGGS